MLLPAGCGSAPETAPRARMPAEAINLNAYPRGPMSTRLAALAASPATCFAMLATAEGLRAAAVPDKDGPGGCGIRNAAQVESLPGAQFSQAGLPLSCPMVAGVYIWFRHAVQPAALKHFGQPVRTIDTWGSYACRSVNNQPGARLSQHALANALDVPGFRLADGTRIRVEQDWNGPDPARRAFLRDVHAAGCATFGTTLGPDSDRFHHDHIHLDMAPWRYCK